MKYEKIAECPKGLEILLKLINSLPENIGEIYLNLKSEFESEKARLLNSPRTPEIKEELFWFRNKPEKKIKEMFSKDVYFFVSGVLDSHIVEPTFELGMHVFLDPLDKFKELVDLKTLFDRIAKFTTEDFDPFPPGSTLTLQPLVSFGLTKTGLVKPYTSPVIEIFSKTDIQIERIKKCPICENIFWSKRIEAQTCSNKKCSNQFHQRKIRIKDYENRLGTELKYLKKLTANLTDGNTLISQQQAKVDKLTLKIKQEKRKNGIYDY